MLASKGAWRLYRHLALFNALALAIAGGQIQNLIIEIPPQHGKSQFWSRYFPAWYIGTFPDRRILLGSYEASFAASWGRRTRDLLEEMGPRLFGVNVRQDSRAVDDWNLEGHDGGMNTAGVEGPLSGRSATGGALIDDPIKNAEEASSIARLDAIWDWWQAVLSTRLAEKAWRILLMTRWAEADPVGRVLKDATQTGPTTWVTPGREKWTVIRLPAIAEEDENWPEWGWTRKKGEVLCPERFSLETMEKRRDNMLDFWWATLYQQRPYPREGGQLKAAWFPIVNDVPALDYSCRAWDLAASEDKSAKQTAGVRIGRCGAGEDRKYFITDIVADWWASGDRDKEIHQTAKADGSIQVVIEQEPGAGGKTQAEAIARKLDGFGVTIVNAGTEGSKVLRADPLASAAKSGRVFLKKAPWNAQFHQQIRSFPGGQLIDMVDAAAHGFNYLSAQPDPEIMPDDFHPSDLIPPEGQIFPQPDRRIF